MGATRPSASGYLVEPTTARLLQFGGMGLTVEVASECLAGRAAAVRIRLNPAM